MPPLHSQERALIFRIIHRDNIAWMMVNGIHCKNSDQSDSTFVGIGNQELIDRRHHRLVTCSPFGTLSDYIPFYFTPHSPMLYNITTGYGGVRRRSNEEIIILVSSLPILRSKGVPFVFTDRHAYLAAAQFYSDLSMLDQIDWPRLRQRDFRRDPEDPGKLERYQAEALVYRHMPIDALVGIACNCDKVAAEIGQMASNHGLNLQTVSRPGWYF
jgi:ssDNA thymidine ADP-ribosyltransferase, DarT